MTKLFNHIGFSRVMLALFAVMAIMLPDVASAASGLRNAMCGALNLIQSDIAQGIATLAVIIVGFGALLGRVQWGVAIVVGLGIGVIFGANAIVSALSAGQGPGGAGSQC